MVAIDLFNGSRRLFLLGAVLTFTIGSWSCRDSGEGKANARADTAVGDITAGVYASGAAARKEVRLPDGTKVVMHAGTVLHISKSFNRSNRELWVEGEALFDVSSGAEKPFIVHTQFWTIQVLGTKFLVDARAKEAGEEVDVLSGRLKVTKSYHSDTDNEPQLLQAGEMVMINRDIDLMEKEKMDGSEMKAWENGD